MTLPEGSPPGADDASEADARMTEERDEVKYLVVREHVARFAAALGRHLPHHRYNGEGANRLPRPRHFVTTIYFDTPSRHQYRAARADREHNLKMRAKEYYDIHPSLAELATDPRQIVKYDPTLWFELKFREGTRSGKQRIGLPKRDVPAFFAAGLVTPEMVEIQQQNYGSEGEAVLREIASYCGHYGEPFRADCLVNYRRLPWQDAEGMLRVTLDVDVAFFTPPPDLWQREYALVRETLGEPKGLQPAGVLEVKSRGALPPWLTELMTEARAECVPFSKFVEASQAVHG